MYVTHALIPLEIRDKGMICMDSLTKEDGSIEKVEGSEKFYPHTGVIVAIGQSAESTLIKTTEGLDTTNSGLLSVDSTGKTSRAGVYAGGDAVNGARTVVEAVAMAKRVAVSMDEYMKSLPPKEDDDKYKKSLPEKEENDPYKNIPVFDEPVVDAFGEQVLGGSEA